ncbi:hypothetical protein [Aureimonas endophytica]|uniref:hypothetical protein n=1 Tax=Aureimonas endophytica TaxID=2027858 RepID=UPI0016686F9D|nr:hypothetical protein [Aureimonas endophytica]
MEDESEPNGRSRCRKHRDGEIRQEPLAAGKGAETRSGFDLYRGIDVKTTVPEIFYDGMTDFYRQYRWCLAVISTKTQNFHL